MATKQDRPKCCGIVPAAQKADIVRYWHNHYKYPYKYLGQYVSAADAERHYAKFRVYTGKEKYKWWTAFKKDIGRPFFVCGNGTERDPRGCSYFEWGDKTIDTMPLCHHGMICKVDGKKKKRPFFGCPRKDASCRYLEWVDRPNEDSSEKQ